MILTKTKKLGNPKNPRLALLTDVGGEQTSVGKRAASAIKGMTTAVKESTMKRGEAQRRN